MTTKLESFIKTQSKTKLPDIRPGDTIRIHLKIPALAIVSAGKKEKGEEKSKTQIFEGLVIAKKHGKEIGSTITVRKIIEGVGVEKIFPLHSPTIDKIEIIKRGKARRAKLYYLRTAKGKRARLKRKEFSEAVAEEKPEETIEPGENPEEIKEEPKIEE